MKFLAAALLLVCLSSGRGQSVGGPAVNPCQEDGGVAPDQQYYDRYWRCVDGAPVLLDCPNGLVFAGAGVGVDSSCDYFWRNKFENSSKSYANGPISAEHCEWLYGIFGHEKSCSRYWTCWNGTATMSHCIGGLLYNEEMHACDWPQNVRGCQKHPLCADDPNGNTPLGKSCQRYWFCYGGYPRLMRCPSMLVFDRKTRQCVDYPTEDCEIPKPVLPVVPSLQKIERIGGPTGLS